MNENGSFIKALKRPGSLIGTLVSVRSPEVAEALVIAGFDWLFVDLEHSTIDVPAAQAIAQAVGLRAYTVLRLSSNNPEHFTKALDTGCDAIVVPLVNDVEAARAAVRFAKYPPIGTRSVGIGRAHSYGLAFKDYVDRANTSVGLILQIEHERAVSNIEEILSVEGVDAVFVGPFDLSASMGLTGQIGHPDVTAAVEKVRGACTRASVPFGIFCGTVALAALEIKNGSKLLVVETDLMLMTRAAITRLRELREPQAN
jgi:2-keto-3-deoxy-L-rhamnonate aldolase RhmA